MIHVMAIDLDYTASSYLPGEGKYLSSSLVDAARKNDYREFCVISHRSAYTLWFPPYNYYVSHIQRDLIWNPVKDWLTDGNTWKLLNHFSRTSVIIDNFSNATHLNCFKVSLDDDVLYGNDACGYVYDNIVKPMEQFNITTYNKIKPLSAGYTWHILQNFGNTKNPQLVQIAKHLSNRYPKDEVVIDFFDDKEKICLQALQVTSDAAWPQNIKLRVFHHHPDTQNITPITAAKPAPTSSASACHKFGIFAAASVIGGCITAACAVSYYHNPVKP